MLENIVHDKKTISLATERLKLLKQKFKLHSMYFIIIIFYFI